MASTQENPEGAHDVEAASPPLLSPPNATRRGVYARNPDGAHNVEAASRRFIIPERDETWRLRIVPDSLLLALREDVGNSNVVETSFSLSELDRAWVV